MEDIDDVLSEELVEDELEAGLIDDSDEGTLDVPGIADVAESALERDVEEMVEESAEEMVEESVERPAEEPVDAREAELADETSDEADKELLLVSEVVEVSADESREELDTELMLEGDGDSVLD